MRRLNNFAVRLDGSGIQRIIANTIVALSKIHRTRFTCAPIQPGFTVDYRQFAVATRLAVVVSATSVCWIGLILTFILHAV